MFVVYNGAEEPLYWTVARSVDEALYLLVPAALGTARREALAQAGREGYSVRELGGRDGTRVNLGGSHGDDPDA